MTKLAIVILNWNGQRFLEQFLPALIRHTPDFAEVIIADNASSDLSLAFLKEHYPQLRVIRNNENEGFSKGYNQALAQVDAEYYCLLNSDIEVTENWVEPVIKLMDTDQTIAAVQPKLLSYNEKNKFEYAGAAGGFIDFLGYPFCRGRLFEFLEEDKGQYNNTMEVFWATGAALFVRSKLYHQLGGLDEDFFAHMEEIDFCWRLMNHGYKIIVHPAATVYHVGGGTLPKNNALKTYLNFRNNLFLLLKNLPENKLFSVFFARFILDQLAALSFLAKGNIKDYFAVWKAQCHFLKSYKKMKAKRDVISKYAYNKMFPYSSVWARYFKFKKGFDGKIYI